MAQGQHHEELLRRVVDSTHPCLCSFLTCDERAFSLGRCDQSTRSTIRSVGLPACGAVSCTRPHCMRAHTLNLWEEEESTRASPKAADFKIGGETDDDDDDDDDDERVDEASLRQATETWADRFLLPALPSRRELTRLVLANIARPEHVLTWLTERRVYVCHLELVSINTSEDVEDWAYTSGLIQSHFYCCAKRFSGLLLRAPAADRPGALGLTSLALGDRRLTNLRTFASALAATPALAHLRLEGLSTGCTAAADALVAALPSVALEQLDLGWTGHGPKLYPVIAAAGAQLEIVRFRENSSLGVDDIKSLKMGPNPRLRRIHCQLPYDIRDFSQVQRPSRKLTAKGFERILTSPDYPFNIHSDDSEHESDYEGEAEPELSRAGMCARCGGVDLAGLTSGCGFRWR